MMLQTPIAAQQSSMSSKRTKATTSARIQIASSPHMLNAEAQPFSRERSSAFTHSETSLFHRARSSHLHRICRKARVQRPPKSFSIQQKLCRRFTDSKASKELAHTIVAAVIRVPDRVTTAQRPDQAYLRTLSNRFDQ